MLKSIAIKLIEYYQDKGGGEALFLVECNFTPTCSEYMKLCINEYGLLRGLKRGINRLNRCNNKNQSNIIEDLP